MGQVKESESAMTYPSVLRAAVVVLASDIAVLRTTVLRVDLSESTHSEGKDSDGSKLHYDYDIFCNERLEYSNERMRMTKATIGQGDDNRQQDLQAVQGRSLK